MDGYRDRHLCSRLDREGMSRCKGSWNMVGESEVDSEGHLGLDETFGWLNVRFDESLR